MSAKIRIPKLYKEILKHKRVSRIYGKFEKSFKINENFVVAVSGGPDSLALAFFAKIYSLKKQLNSKFLIVDHKLRPESTNEAKFVKKLLKNYFINSEILTWKGKKPQKNIQSIARKKRYELLFARCNKYKINNILLGHHQDDLFENFFIRMTRGSGLKGLVSFGRENTIEGKNLLRPLINQKKEDLVFISKSVFKSFIKDPSNNDEKYQRTIIRKLIKGLKKNGLDEKKFLKTIENLSNSNSVVNFYVAENLKKNSSFFQNNNKLILNRNFAKQPQEIVFRSLSESIKLIGKKFYPTRGKKLEKIVGNIINRSSFKSTIGGCLIEKVNQTVIIRKEG